MSQRDFGRRGHRKCKPERFSQNGDRTRLGRSDPRPRGPPHACDDTHCLVRPWAFVFGARARQTTAEAAVIPGNSTASFRVREGVGSNNRQWFRGGHRGDCRWSGARRSWRCPSSAVGQSHPTRPPLSIVRTDPFAKAWRTLGSAQSNPLEMMSSSYSGHHWERRNGIACDQRSALSGPQWCRGAARDIIANSAW